MSDILFIAIDYYGYTRAIVAEMERQGHRVDFFPVERPSFFQKSLKRFVPRFYRLLLDAYHRRIIRKTASRRYDRVIFLQAHQVAPANMQRLIAAQPAARRVLYNWDSLTTHDYRDHLSFFDRALTFDIEDARALGIEYLPLFALPEYSAMAGETARADHDIYFVGSVHSMERYAALARLRDYAAAHALRTRMFLHVSPPMYLKLRQEGKLWPEMSIEPIGTSEIVDMMRASTAVFDFPNHRQSGYTMRLVENLCAGKKIVTSNPHVADEPFFAPDRILIRDGDSLDGLAEFIKAPLTSPLKADHLHLENWVRNLVG